MRDDKSKQEGQFNLEAIKESIERMKPELSTCSAAAHRAKGADDGDDPDTEVRPLCSHGRRVTPASWPFFPSKQTFVSALRVCSVP